MCLGAGVVRVQGAIISCNEAWSHRGRGRSEAFSIRFTIIEQVEAPPLVLDTSKKAEVAHLPFLSIFFCHDTISDFTLLHLDLKA